VLKSSRFLACPLWTAQSTDATGSLPGNGKTSGRDNASGKVASIAHVFDFLLMRHKLTALDALSASGHTKCMNIFSDSKVNRTPPPSPIEVWLSRANMEITCTVVLEDESTSTLDVNSLSMRGAQREITGYFIAHGYTPVGRWEVEADSDNGGKDTVETSRKFKLKLSEFEFESAQVAAQSE
jgi:hypothetical protein